jgi:hypothetical protein
VRGWRMVVVRAGEECTGLNATLVRMCPYSFCLLRSLNSDSALQSSSPMILEYSVWREVVSGGRESCMQGICCCDLLAKPRLEFQFDGTGITCWMTFGEGMGVFFKIEQKRKRREGEKESLSGNRLVFRFLYIQYYSAESRTGPFCMQQHAARS